KLLHAERKAGVVCSRACLRDLLDARQITKRALSQRLADSPGPQYLSRPPRQALWRAAQPVLRETAVSALCLVDRDRPVHAEFVRKPAHLSAPGLLRQRHLDR